MSTPAWMDAYKDVGGRAASGTSGRGGRAASETSGRGSSNSPPLEGCPPGRGGSRVWNEGRNPAVYTTHPHTTGMTTRHGKPRSSQGLPNRGFCYAQGKLRQTGQRGRGPQGPALSGGTRQTHLSRGFTRGLADVAGASDDADQ